MSLNQVYHYDGVTKTAITASVIKLSATQGVYPDFGGMTVELSYPVLDANGSEVTLEKGDLLWCNVNWATTRWFAPGLGEISDIKRSGDFVTVKVDSMLEPLMRMRYVIDNGVGGYVSNRIWDVITKHTPPHGITVSSEFLIYRRETGPETWELDTIMGMVVHGLEVDVRAYFQYLIEQPINRWLEKPTGTIFPVYRYVDHWDLPGFAVGYSGYGNHRQADLTLSRDNGILSEIEWEEPTESVLNDVTITVRGGGSEQFTDAASIAAYGKRQTTLLRGIFTENAIGGYDATLSIRSIVKSMAVPHKRCRLTCEPTAIFNDWQTVGGMYRVIDDATGQDEYMALRSFTYKFPEEVCECVFDNAPLDMSKYGLRMENRVTSLEANMVTAHAGFFDLQGGVSPSEYYHLSQAAYNNLYQQNQGVKTTDSPTFAGLTLGSGNLSANKVILGASIHQIKSDNTVMFTNIAENANQAIRVNHLQTMGTSGQVRSDSDITLCSIDGATWKAIKTNGYYIETNQVIDASRNITCGHIKPHSINTMDLGDYTNYWNECYVGTGLFASIRSLFNSTMDEPAVQLAQAGGKNIWMRMRQSGGGERSGLMFSIYDSHHFYVCGEGADLRFKYTDATTGMNYAASTEIMKLTQSGYLSLLGGLQLYNTKNCTMTAKADGTLRVQADAGYCDIGPGNSTWCHFYTDRTKYYFNRGLDVTGPVIPYSSNTYDLGSSAQKWRNLYLGGSCAIDQNLTVFGDVIGSGVVVASAMATRTISASSTVQHENAVARSTTTFSSPGSVLKRSKVNYAMTGTFYIKWFLRTAEEGVMVYGRLYKNGSTLGALRSTNSMGGVTFTEGPYTNIAAGDEFQIYAYTSAGDVPVWVSALQICFTPGTVLPLYSANL